MMVTLDDSTVTAVEKLTSQEISRESSYAFEHELVWYGIDAVSHHILLTSAREGKIPLDDFVKHYLLDFDPNRRLKHGFRGSIEPLRKEIYIPSFKVNRIEFFSEDYGNRFMFGSDYEFQLCDQLTRRIWNPEDLNDSELTSMGLDFSKLLWKKSTGGFEKYQGGTEDFPIQPQKVTDLGRKLIAYYSSLFR